ncbi:MAG TPA: tetratricopeptide repeat protein [Polyangiaceae bacterium]
MDQFSAHLDRGWDLVQRGDPQGAEQSARRALEIDSQSPEAYNLLGYVAALQGDFEEAVEHYRQAIALDDTYLEAMLNAAEVCIHPMGEFDDALALCEQALDLAENDDEIVDALLLCFDAHLGRGDVEMAKDVCRRFPKGPFENTSHTFLVGRAFFEIGEVQRAAELIEASIQTNAANPDAHYYLGLIRDERGDMAGATEAFLKARELDLEFPPAPWSLSRETFRVTVERAILALSPEHRAYLRPGEVYLADVPGVEAVVDGVDPRTAVLIDALQGENAISSSARVFVYQNNVERLAGGITGVEREITAAIEREIVALFIERSPSQPPASVARPSRPPTSH